MNRTVTTVRWIARSLSVLIILFWGYFIVAHLFGGAGEPARPLTTSDRVQFSMLLVSLLGLAVAWPRELVGAAIALAGALIAAIINPRAVTGLGLLPPVTALLFLVCGWMGRFSGHKNVTAP